MGAIIQKRIKYGSGNDGFSPIVTVTDIENGHKVDVRDINGVKSFEVLNGADGIDAPCDGLMFTSLEELRLTAPTTVGEVFMAMPEKSTLMLNVEAYAEKDGNLPTVTDIPAEYGVLTIDKWSNSRFRIEFNNSLGGSSTTVKQWIGTLKGNDGTDLKWKQINTGNHKYTTMAELALDGSTATIQDVIDKVAVGDSVMMRTDAFNNDNWKTQCNGIQWGYLKIEKTMNNLSNIELQEVITPNRRYFGTQSSGKFAGWVATTGTAGLVSNAQNFKIVLTKNNSSWYGFFTFSFTYGSVPCEITFTISDKVYYTITKGQNIVSALTYTQSGANYIIGIDFTTKIYGTQVVDMPSEFGVINSLTAETFAGNTSANLKLDSARTYTTLAELGLTADATFQDVIYALPKGGSALLGVKEFTNYQTIFPYKEGNDQFARVYIVKGVADGSSMYARWFRKDGVKEAIAIFNINDNKFVGWKEIATKTVADVGFTTINQTNGLTAPTGITMTDVSKVNYCIRNGVCYVHIALHISSISAKVNSWTTIADLPKSVIEAVGTMNCEGNTVPDCMPIRVSQAGKLTLMYKGTTTSTSDWWSYSFSYPVAE